MDLLTRISGPLVLLVDAAGAAVSLILLLFFKDSRRSSAIFLFFAMKFVLCGAFCIALILDLLNLIDYDTGFLANPDMSALMFRAPLVVALIWQAHRLYGTEKWNSRYGP